MAHIAADVKKARPAHQVTPAKPAPTRYSTDCPTRMALDCLADKWSGLALILLADGPLRFNQMRRAVEGLSQKMLSKTLKDLERNGFVTRTAFPTVPVTVEYAITPLGLTLAQAQAAIARWADAHIGEVVSARAAYDGKPQ